MSMYFTHDEKQGWIYRKEDIVAYCLWWKQSLLKPWDEIKYAKKTKTKTKTLTVFIFAKLSRNIPSL